MSFGFGSTSSAFGTKPATTTFGQPAASSTGFGFGTAAPAAAAPSFGFGSPTPAPATAPASTGFGFGTPSAAPATTTGFGFGATAPAPAAGGFGTGTSFSFSSSGGGFGAKPAVSFGAPASATSTFGTAPAPAAGGFGSFGATSFGSFGSMAQPAAAPAPVAKPEENIPLDTKYKDLPARYKTEIDRVYNEFKEPMNTHLETISRAEGVIYEQLCAQLKKLHLKTMELASEQLNLQNELKPFLEELKPFYHDFHVTATNGLSQIRSRGGGVQGGRVIMLDEVFPEKFYLKLADKLDKRMKQCLASVQYFEKQLAARAKVLDANASRGRPRDLGAIHNQLPLGARGQYGQVTRIGITHLAMLIKQQSEAFQRISAEVFAVHQAANEIKQLFLKQKSTDYNPFENADRRESAERKYLEEKMKLEQTAKPVTVAASAAPSAAPAPTAATAPSPAVPSFGAPAAASTFPSFSTNPMSFSGTTAAAPPAPTTIAPVSSGVSSLAAAAASAAPPAQTATLSFGATSNAATTNPTAAPMTFGFGTAAPATPAAPAATANAFATPSAFGAAPSFTGPTGGFGAFGAPAAGALPGATGFSAFGAPASNVNNLSSKNKSKKK